MQPLIFNINTLADQTEKLIAVYSTVSKEWRAIIERFTFSTLHLTPTRFSDFERIARGSRRALVRQIPLDVVLESYDKEARERHENDEDRLRNNEIFTQKIRRTFEILHSCSDDGSVVHGIILSICAFSIRDISSMPYEEVIHGRKAAKYGGSGDILDRRFEQSYIGFLDQSDAKAGERMESVAKITDLRVDCGWSNRWRYISPVASSIIASNLPHLENMNSWLWDNEKKNAGLRESSRQGMRNLVVARKPRVLDALSALSIY